MSFTSGDAVLLPSGQTGRILALARLFDQTYADVFIEPAGPLRRMPAGDLRPAFDPAAVLSGGQGLSPALFLAGVNARQLQALLTGQGILSATAFRITPLPHQVLAVDFVLGQFHPRALLADEVGLGKTIEAAMIFEELKLRRQARRALFVVPAGLTDQWRDEFEQKFGEKFVLYDRTLFAALREIHGREANLWKLNDRIITSLDFVKPRPIRPGLADEERQSRELHNRQVFQDLIDAGWDLVVFDEAHKLSKHGDGAETARYKVGEALARSIPVVLLLTATPHQGEPGQFLHLLNLVDPYGFQTVEDLQPARVSDVVWRTRKRAAVDGAGQRLFKNRITEIYPVMRAGAGHALERQLYDEVTAYVRDNYNLAVQRGDRAFGFLMVLFQRMVTSSTPAIRDALGKRLEKLLGLRRRAAEGQVNPPDPEADEDALQDEDAQTALEELLQVSGGLNLVELEKEIQALQALLELARRTLGGQDAKIGALLDIVEQVCRRDGQDTKFLIFTEFIATQQAVQRTLEGLGYRVALINGKQGLDARLTARQGFAAETQFLISTDAGGEGINLQFCHVLINYDLPWNPMKLEQRIGRLDRIGQTHDVLALNLLIQDTVEQRVRQILEAKLALIRKQFGDDKLADILSTLQDEFNFDRLYIDALVRNQAQFAELEHIAGQIYERARLILEKDELLLPQTQAELERFRERLAQDSQARVRAMLEGYLAGRGEELHEYSRRPGIYYFDLPEEDGFRIHYPDVVFDRELAVADDGLDFIHLNHPLVQAVLADLLKGSAPAAAGLQVKAGALPASVPRPDGPALWALYSLSMTNYADFERQELIAVVVDGSGRPWTRLAKALTELRPAQVEALSPPPACLTLPALLEEARRLAECQAHDRFSEACVARAERLGSERGKIEKYYRQQEGAIAGLAIENIRQGKLRELFERRAADLKSLEERRMLVPDLNLVGMAGVTFQK